MDGEEDLSKMLTLGSAVLFVIGGVGLIVNTYIVINMVRYRNNFSAHTILFLNIAVADCAFALAALAVRAPGLLLQEKFFASMPFCVASFYIIQFTYGASSWSLVLITLDRFIAILFPLKFSVYLNKKTVPCFFLLTWFVVPALYAVTVTVYKDSGHDTVYYDPDLYRCSINRAVGGFEGLKYFALVIFCFLPTLIHVLCYSVMFIKLISLPKMTSSSLKLLKTSIAVFISFTLTWLPTAMLEVLTTHRVEGACLSPALLCSTSYKGFSVLFFYSSILSNPFIYSFSLPKFKEMMSKQLDEAQHSVIIMNNPRGKARNLNKVQGREELASPASYGTVDGTLGGSLGLRQSSEDQLYDDS